MNQFFYLATCDTCKRIMRTLDLPDTIEKREIKQHPITVKELEHMRELSGSYESLFSKRAKLYKERDLKNEQLDESDYKGFILEHYTFLKRPVLIYKGDIFIGNSAKVVESAKLAIDKDR